MHQDNRPTFYTEDGQPIRAAGILCYVYHKSFNDQIKDKKRMARVYPQTMNLDAVISDPRVMGIIKECGGKLYMSEKKWELALEEMFDCFKFY